MSCIGPRDPYESLQHMMFCMHFHGEMKVMSDQLSDRLSPSQHISQGTCPAPGQVTIETRAHNTTELSAAENGISIWR